MDKLDMMRIVVCIAEEGSFTGAASRLNIRTGNASRAVTHGVPRTVQDLEVHTCLQFVTSFFPYASRKYLDAKDKPFMDYLREAVPNALAADAHALSRAARKP